MLCTINSTEKKAMRAHPEKRPSWEEFIRKEVSKRKK